MQERKKSEPYNAFQEQQEQYKRSITPFYIQDIQNRIEAIDIKLDRIIEILGIKAR